MPLKDVENGEVDFHDFWVKMTTIVSAMILVFSLVSIYAVMSFGGFLGIGSRYHALPWAALDYDVKQGGYVVDIGTQKLRDAPSFGFEEDPWADPRYSAGVRDYWGTLRSAA